jgi:hypothetical protein
MIWRLLLIIALLVPLSACMPPVVAEPAGSVPSGTVPAVHDASPPMAAQLVPAVVAMREAIQEAVPAPEPPVTADPADACSTALIVRWEIGSPAQYQRKYQGVIWPQGQSGPTWGLGYDGGHQTRTDILGDWAGHDEKRRLATASGVIGIAAKQRLPEWDGIRTPFPYANEVFAQASLPKYRAGGRRMYGPGFDRAPMPVRCALEGNAYNRGFSTVGDRRIEKRVIRDDCLQRDGDALVGCVAEQLRREKRLWPDVKGLRDRREDEARTAELALVGGSA